MRTILLVLALAALATSAAVAGPGDTLIVQTFTFATPKRPGNGEREGNFVFPPAAQRFEKVLMYYTLKCDPSQSPACGEWDYISYTFLYDSTGRMDSTRLSHANFQVNYANRDTLFAMNAPTYTDLPGWQFLAAHPDTSGIATAWLGAGGDVLPLALAAGHGGRAQFLWRADELLAAGLAPQTALSGLRLTVAQAGATLKNFTIRLRALMADHLFSDAPRLDSLVTLYRATTAFPAPGVYAFPFFTDFTWDGVSGILVDISYDRTDGPAFTVAADITAAATTIGALEPDNALDFAPVDIVSVPVAPFAALDSQVTVAFWQYGDPVQEPRSASVFVAANAKGERVLNAHVPWGDGVVYWDAGGTGGYDRIQKQAQPDDYRGRWNHWAFTKDARSGAMNVYLNGALWNSGTAKTRAMQGIARFTVGADAAGTANHYDGTIDDFAVWNVALDSASIAALAHRSPGSTPPAQANLLALYQFEEGAGLRTANDAGGAPAALVGAPRWTPAGGDRVKNFAPLVARPAVAFERNAPPRRIDSVFVVDSAETNAMMIVLFGDTLRPAVPTDTLYRWPITVRYTYDAAGRAIDSASSPADTMLLRTDRFYYSAPFEVVNRYELGRYITPYGINLDMGAGWTWVYDVSDFRPLLADTVHLVSGNWQELHDLKFAFIEGTPARDVLKIENLWRGDFSLKNFSTAVPPRTVALDPAARSFKLRVTASGHQFSNPTNCAEFCPKIHSLDINGRTRYQWQIVQECAMNPLHPQGGTWIYDRAGWCPGMPVATRELELTPYVAGDSVVLDYNSEYDDYGNYVVETQLVSYGPPNRANDVAVDQIIAPNNEKLYMRFNPCCGRPRIVLRNAGSAVLTRCDITYGPEGGNTATHHWTGSLAFEQSEEVDLPAFAWGAWNPDNIFRVTADAPNGAGDEYMYNNSQSTVFSPAPGYDSYLITSNQTANAGTENTLRVLDADGTQVFARGPLANNTLYRDTLAFPPGCYELLLDDDANDGISFWAHSEKGTGSFRLGKLGGGLYKLLNTDFGKQLRYAFSYSSLVRAEEPVPASADFTLYPNPASSTVRLSFGDDAHAGRSARVTDLMGRVLIETARRDYGPGAHELSIDVASLPPGVYTVTLTGARPATRLLHVVR